MRTRLELRRRSTAPLAFGPPGQISLRSAPNRPETLIVTSRIVQHEEMVIAALCGTQPVDASGKQRHHPGCAVPDGPSNCRHVGREQIEEGRPMCSHKRPPSHRPSAAWRYAVFLENASNRGPTDVVSEVLQGALNPRIAPGRVLGRHAHDQPPDVCLQTGTSPPATGVLSRNSDVGP
jgi:hypothetical protein